MVGEASPRFPRPWYKDFGSFKLLTRADIQRLFYLPVRLPLGASYSFCSGLSMSRSSTTSRIMYIESKADGLNGSARIGRVTFSKTRLSIYYKGRTFFRVQGLDKLSRAGNGERVLDFQDRVATDKIVCTSAIFLSRSMRTCARSIGLRFVRNLISRVGLEPDPVLPLTRTKLFNWPGLHRSFGLQKARVSG